MKKLLFLILICFAQNVSSQTIKKDDVLIIDEPNNTPPPQGAIRNDDNNIYNTAGIDVKPEFPGGQEAFYKFFKQNYRITTDNLKGKIYVTFIIEKDGSLTDIKILRDIGHQTGAEAIRILRKSPKWSPGIQNNKQVRVLYSLPITIN